LSYTVDIPEYTRNRRSEILRPDETGARTKENHNVTFKKENHAF